MSAKSDCDIIRMVVNYLKTHTFNEYLNKIDGKNQSVFNEIFFHNKVWLKNALLPDGFVQLNPEDKQENSEIKLKGSTPVLLENNKRNFNDVVPAIDVDGFITSFDVKCEFLDVMQNADIEMITCRFIQAFTGTILQNSTEVHGILLCSSDCELKIEGTASYNKEPIKNFDLVNKEYIDTNFIPTTGSANVGALSLYLTNPIVVSLGRHKNIEMTGGGTVYFLESASLYGDEKALFQILAEPSTPTSITNKAYVDNYVNNIKTQIISEFSKFMEHTLLKDIVDWQPANIKLTQFIDNRNTMTEQAIFYLIDNYYKDTIYLSPRSIHFQHSPSTPNISKGIYDMYINPDRVDESGHFDLPAIKIVDDSQRSDTELHYDIFYWQYKGYQGVVPDNPITTIARIGRSINYMGSGDLSFLTLSTTRVSNTSPSRALRIYDKCGSSQSINNILRLQSDDFGSRWIALQSSADDIIDETHDDEIAKIPEILEAPPAIYKRYAIKNIDGENMECLCLSEFVKLNDGSETLVRELYIKPLRKAPNNQKAESQFFNRPVPKDLKSRYFFYTAEELKCKD